jgi:hypothetical protein
MSGKYFVKSFLQFGGIAIALALSVFIASCGSSGGSGASGYNVTITEPATGFVTGKSEFQIAVTKKSDGSPATGLASQIVLYPLMHMSTMNHSSPVPADAVTESSTPGVYDCTVFFLMATMSATEYWDLQVTLSGETATFNPNVGMAMGSDTVRATLKNNSDMIMSMDGAMSARSYYLFKDDATVGTHGGEFTIFLATQQEGLMMMPPVVAGMSMMDMNNQNVQMTVTSLDLSASIDGTTWEAMTCDANARCSVHIHELVAGTASTVYVKMNINGNDYTTDGSAVSSTNGYATFTVTPGAM